MSKQDNADLTTPFTPRTNNKLLGHINRMSSSQIVAASLAADVMGQAADDHFIGDLFLVSGAIAASGESMTVDVLKNGVSILSGVYTIDASTPVGAQVSLLSLIDADKRTLAPSDILTCTRVYTAGGGPTPMLNTGVFLEPAKGPYME